MPKTFGCLSIAVTLVTLKGSHWNGAESTLWKCDGCLPAKYEHVFSISSGFATELHSTFDRRLIYVFGKLKHRQFMRQEMCCRVINFFPTLKNNRQRVFFFFLKVFLTSTCLVLNVRVGEASRRREGSYWHSHGALTSTSSSGMGIQHKQITATLSASRQKHVTVHRPCMSCPHTVAEADHSTRRDAIYINAFIRSQ